ncbi:MAG TPA: NAD-dependent epimerase/dehydratase family protein, partial [Myxococcota bacterium]|nr:NAD-dependent epimerase/dehydratase family protein [Myxococcota bacterium]
MQILVTGANGLLGNHLVRELLRAGNKVRGLVRQGSNLQGLAGLNVELAYGDVRDGAALRAASDGCELLYHTAAVFAYTGHSAADMESTARDGASNVVQVAKDAGIKRLILTSSTVVLGGSDTPVALDERAELSGQGMPDYFTTKALQERTALARGRELGIEVVAVNPAVFIGPHDFRPSASLSTITAYLLDPLKVTYGGGINLSHVT